MATKKTGIETPEIQDISMTSISKQKFRINGDNRYIIELDVHDLGITSRLSDAYPKLVDAVKEAQQKVTSIDEASDEALMQISTTLVEIDKKMRDLIDYIFDSPVSAVCAPSGTLYDPVNGQFKFEIILSALLGLYTANINSEFKKMQDNVSKHTNKYTKKYHK